MAENDQMANEGRWDQLLEKATYSQVLEAEEADAAEFGDPDDPAAPAARPRHRGFVYDPADPRAFASEAEIDEYCDAANAGFGGKGRA